MKHYELPAGTDREQRQQRGVFYTPDSIVDFMVANALHGKQFPLKICDYSCGGGAFLAGVLRYFKKHFPEKASEAARHLYGIDIDPAALQLAKKNVPDIPESNFLCADTLHFSLPETEKFDLIIGNPPYRCSGIRNRKNFPAKELQHLKKLFPHGFEYKMNLFALFIEQALRIGKECCLIVPDSLLCGRYFSKLRRFITENFQISSLWLVEKPSFDAATGNCVILHTGALSSSPVQCGLFRQESTCTSSQNYFAIDQKTFLQEPRCRFQLAFSPFEYALARKIIAGSTPLVEYFDFASGIIARNGKSSLISIAPSPTSKPGIIYGREILPFEICRQGAFIDLTPEKIKSGLKPERFAAPKIFLRQTGSSLVAASVYEELYALNNCHVGVRKNDFPLESGTALLNSAVLNFIYRYLSGERNRNFAQIDIDILNTIPLRRSSRFDHFAAACAKNPALRCQLDQESAILYDLSAAELEWIKATLSSGKSSK
ncbi:MAG: N-6 DNA methylase [Lentisphaeria bacterium]|nr:N-6 DNA methylase [Lentisphaeria bacterium]